ncbi:hypothetical protein HPB51_002181 [Rhipicephalus microplus]|uniref:Uncharacterized protein n=1 Tax=Rhipicephalus microplus TaxID=6941 RepID=A0A9J6EKF8_RHIMP|nr:hypothetical protein HPB51_002181 [Rhipicephalus microplus]
MRLRVSVEPRTFQKLTTVSRDTRHVGTRATGSNLEYDHNRVLTWLQDWMSVSTNEEENLGPPPMNHYATISSLGHRSVRSAPRGYVDPDYVSEGKVLFREPDTVSSYTFPRRCSWWQSNVAGAERCVATRKTRSSSVRLHELLASEAASKVVKTTPSHPYLGRKKETREGVAQQFVLDKKSAEIRIPRLPPGMKS